MMDFAGFVEHGGHAAHYLRVHVEAGARAVAGVFHGEQIRQRLGNTAVGFNERMFKLGATADGGPENEVAGLGLDEDILTKRYKKPNPGE